MLGHLKCESKLINVNKTLFFTLAAMMLFLSNFAIAQPLPPEMSEITSLTNGIATVAGSLGALMLAYAGLRWLMADGPQERDDARKTIIYIIIGLLVVSATTDLVHALYCDTMNPTSYGAGVC
jgi:hypothetical protein